jgi:hypothetical protein
LNWFNSEKLKDQRDLNKNKEKLVREIKGLRKEDLFPAPVKISLWNKIKIILLGR